MRMMTHRGDEACNVCGDPAVRMLITDEDEWRPLCKQHAEWCLKPTCDTCDELEGDCECCGACERHIDDCTCCGMCGETEEYCECCFECESHQDYCTCNNCDECNEHYDDCTCGEEDEESAPTRTPSTATEAMLMAEVRTPTWVLKGVDPMVRSLVCTYTGVPGKSYCGNVAVSKVMRDGHCEYDALCSEHNHLVIDPTLLHHHTRNRVPSA